MAPAFAVSPTTGAQVWRVKIKIAITSEGIGKETDTLRMYTFPHDSTRVLHLLAIGHENTRDSDVEYCRTIILGAISSPDPSNTKTIHKK